VQLARGELAVGVEVGEAQVAGNRRAPQVHGRDDPRCGERNERREPGDAPQTASGSGARTGSAAGAGRRRRLGPLYG
jgi:hypothetical protein